MLTYKTFPMQCRVWHIDFDMPITRANFLDAVTVAIQIAGRERYGCSATFTALGVPVSVVADDKPQTQFQLWLYWIDQKAAQNLVVERVQSELYGIDFAAEKLISVLDHSGCLDSATTAKAALKLRLAVATALDDRGRVEAARESLAELEPQCQVSGSDEFSFHVA